MRKYIFLVILCTIICIEGTITTLPIVLALLIAYVVSSQNEDVFFLAFISGIFLDILQVKLIGITSIYFLCSMLLVLMYQRKYEIASYPFIAFSSFFLSLIYCFIFIHTAVIYQAMTNVVVAEISFILCRLFLRLPKNKHAYL